MHFGLLLVLLWSATSVTAFSPFTCTSSAFVIEGNALYSFDLPTSRSTLYETGFGIQSQYTGKVNALGYNFQDNFLYGVMSDTSVMIRISSDNNYQQLMSLPTPSYGYWNAGDIDDNNQMWLFAGNSQYMQLGITSNYILSSGTATAPTYISDWVFMPGGGRALWSVNVLNGGIALIRFDMSTKQFTTVATYGLLTGTTATNFNAMFAVTSYVFEAIDVNTLQVWRFDVTGATAPVQVTSAVDTNIVDGARCISGLIVPTTTTTTTTTRSTTTSSTTTTTPSTTTTTTTTTPSTTTTTPSTTTTTRSTTTSSTTTTTTTTTPSTTTTTTSTTTTTPSTTTTTSSTTTTTSRSSTISSSTTTSTSTPASTSTTSSAGSVTSNSGLAVSSTSSQLSSSVSSVTSSVSPTATCFADNVNGAGRVLASAATSSGSMTNKYCQSYCSNLGFAYAGTEYSSECYCSNTLPVVTSTNCNMVCSGSNTNEICGGPNALSVVYNATVVSANAQLASLANSWTNQGCRSDNYPVRVLSGASTTSSSMTINSCISFCNSAGYTIAGVEYASECYCGNAVLTDGSTYGVASSGCSFPCSGNSTAMCGGPNLLNVYSKAQQLSLSHPVVPTPTSSAAFTPVPTKASGYNYMACYTDSGARTLATQLPDVPSVESCVAACSRGGYLLAGLEYYSQCWCGNAILNSALPIAASNCAFTCTGSSNETCGGSWALQIYQGQPSAASPIIPQSAVGYTYVDSYLDGNTRVLPNGQSLTSNTVQGCVSSCASYGYSYAGVEYGSQCFCGNSLVGNPAGGQIPSMPCQGNAANYCGGPNVLQVYKGNPVSAVVTFVPAMAVGTCALDYTPGHGYVHILNDMSTSSSTMTPAVCKAFCNGFKYYGVEYASECYCGNTIASWAVTSLNCGMACSGDSSSMCGGSWAMNVYTS